MPSKAVYTLTLLDQMHLFIIFCYTGAVSYNSLRETGLSSMRQQPSWLYQNDSAAPAAHAAMAVT